MALGPPKWPYDPPPENGPKMAFGPQNSPKWAYMARSVDT